MIETLNSEAIELNILSSTESYLTFNHRDYEKKKRAWLQGVIHSGCTCPII